MRIDFIDGYRDQIATLAAWHHAEWGHLYSHWTLEVAAAELADHATRRTLPTTLVLMDGSRLLGSVSVVLEDAPELNDAGSPWLASLYVVAQARGRGLGARLVQAAVALAASQRVPQMFLFTPDHAAFYRRLGWNQVMRAMLQGTAVDLMEIAPLQVAGIGALQDGTCEFRLGGYAA